MMYVCVCVILFLLFSFWFLFIPCIYFGHHKVLLVKGDVNAVVIHRKCLYWHMLFTLCSLSKAILYLFYHSYLISFQLQ